MSVLVLNAGSSSLKFMVAQTAKALTGAPSLRGQIEGIGTTECRMQFQGKTTPMPKAKMAEGLLQALDCLPLGDIQAVGHRVVHGGSFFHGPALVNVESMEKIRQLIPLAPLHNPACLAGIEASLEALPKLRERNVACFDTAFHASMPPVAYTYAVPWELAQKQGIRRYGFHGLSVEYVVNKTCELLELRADKSHMLVCHLGAGASATAVKNGKSVDTSMGLTPLDGLVMGTRSGSVDPGLFSYVAVQTGMTESEITNMFNNESGLLGISGVSSDMRLILEKANSCEDPAMRDRCILARDVFIHRVCQTIAMLWVDIARMDCLVFTGGVGENSPEVRQRIADKWSYRGLQLDPELNEKKDVEGVISSPRSAVQVCVVRTNEELQIAKHTRNVLAMFEE